MSKSKVVVVKSSGVIRASGKVNTRLLAQMVEQGLCRLTSESSSEDAIRHYFSPKDKVGLKVNCLAGRMASTHPEIALVVAGQLKAIGVKEKNMIMWDRSSRELEEVGYSLNANGDGPRCYGTDAQGVGYSQDLINYRNIGSLLSRIMESFTTVQLNLPVLKDHSLSGVTCALKNYFGAVHNPNKYHDDGCDPFIADLNQVPQIREQQRLVVCDALRVQYNGGPAYHPQWAENFGGIVVGDDPVAVDFVGYQIIDRIRRGHGLPSLEKAGRKPKHIFTAADGQHNLGKASLEEIDLVETRI
ncbi:MAG: DUF362 domain-containing protein [Candidatus Zixiibacteriota bacterium]|nr:MAG: DUF362 domain-containing protein [candidate division Zixibacteria bacterium]